MLRHIVLFSLVDFPSSEAKHAQLTRIKSELEALPACISELRSLKVFFNENPDEAYDFVLEAELDSLACLSIYAQHPEHQRVAREYIKPYVKARACVDFMI